VAEITDGLAGVSWSDPIAIHGRPLIFVNDRSNEEVIVLHTTAKQSVVKRIDVGPRPVHLYQPLGGDEVWTHSDEEGAFYVIDINTLEVTGKVVAALHNTGHGKLLYHEALGQKAYATNSNDPAIFVLDLATKQVVGTIELAEARGGTHGKAYSPRSAQAYFECTGMGKTAVVDTATDTIAEYVDAFGQPFPTPDGRYVVVADRRTCRVDVIDVTRGNQLAASISVAGAPDKIYFHERDGQVYGFTANTLTPDCAAVDLQEMKEIARIAAGDIKRDEHAHTHHRSGEVGGGFFFTPAAGDGFVAIIDADSLRLHATVPVADVQEVLYVSPE
jgi:DNA-binding beta-propeller fold protein YncE